MAALLAAAGLGQGGCATPGPLHVYTPDSAAPPAIVDHAPDGARAEVPGFLEPEDQLTGFAYDPFTDHFFLRLAPGNHIRVVDRPARAIKREFTIAAAPAQGGGDLAVRPRDGHLFLLHPTDAALLETSRFGKLRRTLRLAGLRERPAGVAYDSGHNRLLVLAADGRQITVHDPDGRQLAALSLDREVGRSLAFDAEQREYYARLASSPAEVAVFDEQGRLQRTIRLPGTFIDVGPRSLIRVF